VLRFVALAVIIPEVHREDEINLALLIMEGSTELTQSIADGANTTESTGVDSGLGDTSSTAAPAGGGLQSTLMMVGWVAVFGAVMYLFIFRPQKKKQKKEEALRKNVQVGDEIVTIGGLYGRVVSLKEDSVVIESVDHSKSRVAKWAIQANNTIHDD